MGFQCGIVGLPNVGKSTIFNALTSSAQAEAANFPFCTIEPNKGIVEVPDARLLEITKRVNPKKTIPANMVFVDIAGLVAGASKGEGLGNQFLAHIRETQAIAHVVRCFEDDNVVHVDGSVSPLRDIGVIDTELLLADADTVAKRHDALQRKLRGGDKEAAKLVEVLAKIQPKLDEGVPVRRLALTPDERRRLSTLHLLTAKPVMYVANVDEDSAANPGENPMVQAVTEFAAEENALVVPICGKIESELAELSGEEREEFLADMGLAEPGLDRVIRAGYTLLDLKTYFTAGEKEVRAWTFPQGALAPQAAGVIHSDFERGFIKADVYHYDDLIQYGSESAVKEAGKMRLEGKGYEVRDGDIMHFRFSV